MIGLADRFDERTWSNSTEEMTKDWIKIEEIGKPFSEGVIVDSIKLAI